MSENRSLEDFFGGSAESASGDADSDADGDAVQPAAATYRWDAGGLDCAGCGESVERLWRDGDEFVCEACKEW